MKQENIEIFLSKDILQGEEIPFYILWKRNDIRDITFELNGFTAIGEYHNVDNDFPIENRIVKIEDLKSRHFLGGTLKTEVSNNPFKKAFLKIIFTLSNGEEIEIIKERTLYNTNLEIFTLPQNIKVPFDKPPIEILLKGSTTVFIDIATTEDSDLNLELPEEIQNALEKFYQALMKGLRSLRNEYPEYENIIDSILKTSYELSERQLFEKLIGEFEEKKPDISFSEAIAMVFLNALLSQSGIKDSVIRPLIEYFESNATDKAYLMAPFLNLNISKGGGKLKLLLYCINIVEKENILSNENILENILEENINFLIIETFIESDRQIQIPIKELIKIRRSNESNK
jgi:hypothetical protein